MNSTLKFALPMMVTLSISTGGCKDKPKQPAPTQPVADSKVDLPVDKGDKPTPPQGGIVIAKMQASLQKLDVDPPQTVGKHVSATMTKIKAPPKVTCKAGDGGKWRCEVWPGDEFGYSYAGEFEWKNAWHLVDGSAVLVAATAVKTKPPHGGVIIDLMQVSKQKLDIDPPETVAKHLTDTLAKVKKTPKVTCAPAEASQWQCEVWPGDEFGYFYSATFDPKDGWRMVEGSAELSPDD